MNESDIANRDIAEIEERKVRATERARRRVATAYRPGKNKFQLSFLY